VVTFKNNAHLEPILENLIFIRRGRKQGEEEGRQRGMKEREGGTHTAGCKVRSLKRRGKPLATAFCHTPKSRDASCHWVHVIEHLATWTPVNSRNTAFMRGTSRVPQQLMYPAEKTVSEEEEERRRKRHSRLLQDTQPNSSEGRGIHTISVLRLGFGYLLAFPLGCLEPVILNGSVVSVRYNYVLLWLLLCLLRLGYFFLGTLRTAVIELEQVEAIGWYNLSVHS
jgi:hypothetical protein